MVKDPKDMTPAERADWERRIRSHAAIQGITVDEFLQRVTAMDPAGDYAPE